MFRAPFFTSGVTNYLFSFQSELITMKQYAIGNAIGFIPGSILFCMFGNELMRCYEAISSERTYSEGVKKHPREVIIFGSVVLIGGTGCFVAWRYIQSLIKKSEEDDTETSANQAEQDGDDDENKNDE